MKRAGNLIERIAETENILASFAQARRDKWEKQTVISFSAHLDDEVRRIQDDLLAGTVQWGAYHRFRIYDPKERVICAAPFRDRVIHHAIMNVCEPYFESYQLHDSYACRTGKGLDAALERARQFSRRNAWFLKMDIRKYFDSVEHSVLKTLLRRRFKDYRLLGALDTLIDGYETEPGRGIPIGNLTSQFFANHYLARWDHFAKERLKARCYVRYMDDFIVWSDNKEELKDIHQAAADFLRNTLRLCLKPAILNKTALGMTFLGYRIFPCGMVLSRRSRTRFKRKIQRYHQLYCDGVWSEEAVARHTEPLISFIRRAGDDRFPRRVFERLGRCPEARTA